MQLVHQKRKHHDGKEDQAQVLFAKAEVVFEVVALVFERVEGFILDSPTSAAAAHHVVGVVLGEGKGGNTLELTFVCFLRMRVGT